MLAERLEAKETKDYDRRQTGGEWKWVVREGREEGADEREREKKEMRVVTEGRGERKR